MNEVKRRTPAVIVATATLAAALALSGAVAAAEGSRSGAQIDEFSEPGLAARADGSPAASAAGPRGTTAIKKGDRGNVPRTLLSTGFADLLYQAGDAESTAVFDQTVDVNAGVVRLSANWSAIAPPKLDPGFDAADPSSPGYSWSNLDAAVRKAAARGLRVVILISQAPSWAEGANRPGGVPAGSWKPSPGQLRKFGTAIATRYSGSFADLPAVRDYQLWAEPNLTLYLNPQWEGLEPAAPAHYRRMLSAFHEGVHGVSAKNNVVTGGTAPYGADPGVWNMRPVLFWREVMCLQGRQLEPSTGCDRAKFDVFAHHPINTTGGPSRGAFHSEDVSTPDLHKLVKVLRAAERAKTIGPAGSRPVWATEIWWESNPPDSASNNPGIAKQARWYQESLYTLWKQGVSMVLLLQVQDAPYDGEPGRFNGNYQTGVFYADGTPKPAATAISFPLVADRRSRAKVKLWGRAPQSGKLIVERRESKGLKRVGTIRAKRGKVFTDKVGLPKRGKKYKLRARIGRTKSLIWTVR